MIYLKVGNIETDIVGDIHTSDFYTEFIALRKKMSYRLPSYIYSPAYKSGKWDGWRRLAWFNKKRCYFPTGLVSIAKEHFKERNIEYKIIDARVKPDKNLFLELNPKFEVRDYQKRVIDNSVLSTRGIIKCATGGGKTFVSAGIIQQCQVAPFIFLVTTIDLLEQSKEALQSYLIKNGQHIKVGAVGGGNFDIQDITVMTVHTAVRALGKKFIKYDEEEKTEKDDESMLQQHRGEIVNLLHNCKGAICDETHHWKAEMCQIVTNSLYEAYYKIGASATPYRDEGDDLLIQCCFGKTICEVSASELIQKGFLVKPNIHFVHVNSPPSKLRDWQNIYKAKVVEDDYYNSLVATIAEEYIKKGDRVLLLVQQIEHGNRLESLIGGSYFIHGSSSKKDRLDSLNKLRNGYIKCLITSVIGDEGLDIKALNTLILAGQGRSATRALQRIGRALRIYPGKEHATIVDFYIHEKYLEEHAKAREKMYKTEPEFVIEHNFLD